MKIILETGPHEVRTMTSDQLRKQFLASDLVKADQINLVYTIYERMILGCVNPVTKPIRLETYDALKSTFFLERRELGIINVGERDLWKRMVRFLKWKNYPACTSAKAPDQSLFLWKNRRIRQYSFC